MKNNNEKRQENKNIPNQQSKTETGKRTKIPKAGKKMGGWAGAANVGA